MTSFSNLFNTYSPCSGSEKIRIADGSFSPIAGKGCRRGGVPTAMRLSRVVREENEGTGVKHGHWTVRRN